MVFVGTGERCRWASAIFLGVNCGKTKEIKKAEKSSRDLINSKLTIDCIDFEESKQWSERRVSNPRPQPWQGSSFPVYKQVATLENMRFERFF